MRNKFFPLMGICCGVLAIIFAIIVFSGGGSKVGGMDTGTYTKYNYYGGDAYTGIQQAAADTARNVQSLSQIVRSGFQGVSGSGLGYLLLVLGIALIAFSLHTLNEMKARDSFEAQVLAALTGCSPAVDNNAPTETGYPEEEKAYEEEPEEENVPEEDEYEAAPEAEEAPAEEDEPEAAENPDEETNDEPEEEKGGN